MYQYAIVETATFGFRISAPGGWTAFTFARYALAAAGLLFLLYVAVLVGLTAASAVVRRRSVDHRPGAPEVWDTK
jgi:ABC-type nitrate/sulfonate/bicarbonate transport system substrate-binding protein